MKRLAALILVGALPACVSAPGQQKTTEMVQALPHDYRAQIKQKIKFTLYDPYSIRDPEITAPTAVFVGLAYGGHAPGVCVRFNARNALGAYVGMQTWVAGFRDGAIAQFHQALYTDCDKAGWQPAPDLAG